LNTGLAGPGRNVNGGYELAPVLIFVWILLGAVAVVLVAFFGLIVVWMLLLRRMARSGIQSWDELEPEDAELLR
jgi:hypothetical protein